MAQSDLMENRQIHSMTAGENSTNKRIEWIDLARATAILLVVLCHACESFYSFELEHFSTYPLYTKFSAMCMHTLGRWGVPLFLMISGYLMLDRHYDSDRCAHFWRHNWLRLVACTAIWIVINDVFRYLAENVRISIPYLIEKELYMVNISDMGHMWYMPMIVGLYLMLPFIANGLRSIDIRYLRMPMIVYMIVSFVYPAMGVVAKSFNLGTYGQQLAAGFSGGVYGLYMILGYMIKKNELKKIPGIFLGALVLASLMGGIGLQLFAYAHGYQYDIWYNDLSLVLCAICLFELFSRIRRVAWHDFIRFLARYSFAVYLIHNLVCRLIHGSLAALPCAQWGKVLLMWGIAVFVSYLLAAALNRIPKLGKYLLFVK